MMWVFEWVFGWFGGGDVAGRPTFFYEWSDSNLFNEWQGEGLHYEWSDRR